MGTKITIIAMGLALIVTVRDYLIYQIGNHGSGKLSSIEIIKEAFSIIKAKIRK